MSWELPRLRVDDVFGIQSKEEILGARDEQVCLDGLPLMRAMFASCARSLLRLWPRLCLQTVART